MFGGGRSIQLARVFGIRVGATPSWFFVLFALIYLLTGYFGDVVDVSSTGAFALAVAAALLFFLSVTLHELGHAVVSRRNGIGIAGIDLFFFGGVTMNTREAESPGEEFRVAAAGPAVTAVIVLVCLGAAAALNHYGDVVGVAQFDDRQTAPVYALLGFVGVINLVLLVFNLVPALPLDGGRIARAIAWRITGDRHRGTRLAGRAGQGFAVLVGGFGVFTLATGDSFNGLYWLVLAWFLHQSARAALLSSDFSVRIGGIAVSDVMDQEPVTIPADLPALRAEDEFFLRYGWPWFAVADDRGRYVGILRREEAERCVAEGRPTIPVSDLVDEDPSRFRIGRDQPLEALLGVEGLRDLGALIAVDAEGVLVGVVSVEQIRRALSAAASTGL